MEPKTISLPKTAARTMEYSLLALSFLIPLLISGPQILTGAIVNMLLFLFVSHHISKRILPIVVLPSIGAVLNGVLFGTFTPFLLYFLPFIWIGNYVLIASFRSMLKKNSFLISVLGSSLFKSAILFLTAYLFTTTKVVPTIFLQVMGIFQLATAIMGGIGAFGIQKIISQKA